MAVGSLKGRLLVANPAMLDPNFHRTVVLVLEHTADGALGVVLNRPSDAPVADALPQWDQLATHPPVLFVGGPVEPGAAICLAEVTSGSNSEHWQQVLGRLGTLDLGRADDRLRSFVRGLRVFAGYSGWAAGQLEDEVAAGGWVLARAQVGDVLHTDPAGLWRSVLRRQPGGLAGLASFPADPSLN